MQRLLWQEPYGPPAASGAVSGMKRSLCLIMAALLLALLLALSRCGEKKGPERVNVPILMYHHMDETGGTDTVISRDGFRAQMELLRSSGYTPVGLDALVAFVDGEGTLPEKPVCVTFDDGYESTYSLAWPILREYGCPATVFVIGVSVGKDTYKDGDQAIIPHFGTDQMAEMASSGTMSIQSHTFDMHQWAPYEQSETPRTSMLPFEGETEAAYAAAVTGDFRQEAAVLAAGGVDGVWALAFPLGRHTELTDQILKDLGVRVTLTTDGDRVNTVVRGDPDSLYGLGRLNMTDALTDEIILAYLSR